MKLTIENVIIFLISIIFLFILILVVQNLHHNFLKQNNSINVNYFIKGDKLYITGLLNKKMICSILLQTENDKKIVFYNKTMSSLNTYFRFNFSKGTSNVYNYTIKCCSVTNSCFNVSNKILTK